MDQMAGYRPPAPAGESHLISPTDTPFNRWILLFLPALGGIISGWLVYTFAPEAEGHGTDAAIDSYHNKGGFIRGRIPFVKTIASAVTITTGGSGGREGPIAQIGAAFGPQPRDFPVQPTAGRTLQSAYPSSPITPLYVVQRLAVESAPTGRPIPSSVGHNSQSGMNGGIGNIAYDHGKSNSLAYSALALISRQLPANRTLNIRNKPRAGKHTSRFFFRAADATLVLKHAARRGSPVLSVIQVPRIARVPIKSTRASRNQMGRLQDRFRVHHAMVLANPLASTATADMRPTRLGASLASRPKST